MSADVGRKVVMVYYSLTNPITIQGMLMVGCGCGLGVDNVITMNALFRLIDGVKAVLWCGEGSAIITVAE